MAIVSRAIPFRRLMLNSAVLMILVIDRISVAEDLAITSKSPVGVSAKLSQLILPGTELEAKPIEDRKTPVVVRVMAAYRHGTDYRYDLEYYGLEPAAYDLRDYLTRKDSSSMENIPAIPVSIETKLTAGQLVPSATPASPLPWIGGYRLALYGLATLWLTGLAWLIFGGRRKVTKLVEIGKETSLADLLKPLVAKAMTGHLDPAGQAELERLLLCYWRRRLDLEQSDPVTALTEIRNHPVAGDLLRQVEEYLHRPGAAKQIDFSKVLAPYQHLADDIDIENSISTDGSSMSSHSIAASSGV